MGHTNGSSTWSGKAREGNRTKDLKEQIQVLVPTVQHPGGLIFLILIYLLCKYDVTLFLKPKIGQCSVLQHYNLLHYHHVLIHIRNLDHEHIKTLSDFACNHPKHARYIIFFVKIMLMGNYI